MSSTFLKRDASLTSRNDDKIRNEWKVSLLSS